MLSIKATWNLAHAMTMLDLRTRGGDKRVMKHRDKASLYRELAKLTEADFHLDRSLSLLLGQSPAAEKRAYLEGMKRGLESGQSIAESITKNNAALVGGLETSLIEAGERSGKMANAFNHLARYFSAMDGAKRQATGALIYPLILVHLAILLPELPALIVAQEDDHPTRRIMLGLIGLWAVLLGGAAIWRWLSHRSAESAEIDRLLNRVPFLGSARKHWALARFTQVAHACLLAALNMSETVRIAGKATQSGVLKQGATAAAESIEDGETLSLALAETGDFPAEFVHAIATAEEVGKVDEEMARWTAAETMMANEAIERASLWLPKIGYALVALFTAYRIVSMVQGIYGGMLKQFE
jgi:type II secretory pathway component PulF